MGDQALIEIESIARHGDAQSLPSHQARIQKVIEEVSSQFNTLQSSLSASELLSSIRNRAFNYHRAHGHAEYQHDNSFNELTDDFGEKYEIISTPDTVSLLQAKVDQLKKQLDGEHTKRSKSVARALRYHRQLKLRATTVLGATANSQDKELAALEQEVAAMLEVGAPEYYANRSDRKENAIAFLKRVYGKYLEPGKEVLFQDQLRAIDPKYCVTLDKTIRNGGERFSIYVPPKSVRNDRIEAAHGLNASTVSMLNAREHRRKTAKKQDIR